MSALLAVVLAGEDKKSGPIGLAVILLLCIACYFLFKSMSKHLRKVREEFPADGSEPAPTSAPTPSADLDPKTETETAAAPADASPPADEPPPA